MPHTVSGLGVRHGERVGMRWAGLSSHLPVGLGLYPSQVTDEGVDSSCGK